MKIHGCEIQDKSTSNLEWFNFEYQSVNDDDDENEKNICKHEIIDTRA